MKFMKPRGFQTSKREDQKPLPDGLCCTIMSDIRWLRDMTLELYAKAITWDTQDLI